MNKSPQNKENEQVPGRIWFWAILGCFLLWILGSIGTRYIAEHCFAVSDGDSAALYGDSFGAINALISALAFAGVIVTFYLQRKELDLQRQELKAQREEFTQQNKTLKLQRFENTFFHMMELQQQIVNDLYIQLNEREQVTQGGQHSNEVIVDTSVKGRQVFEYIYLMRTQFRRKEGCFGTILCKGLKCYNQVIYRELLDHYFRHLYTILRYVDETDAFNVNDEGVEDSKYTFVQKYHYTTIVRATLSRYELLLLYYNGLSEFGKLKLKPLIERYALLNNLDIQSLSFSQENLNLCKIEFHDQIKWKECDLTGTDYEFYLTSDVHDKSRYLIDAFCHTPEEYEEARMALSRYKKFIAKQITSEANN